MSVMIGETISGVREMQVVTLGFGVAMFILLKRYVHVEFEMNGSRLSGRSNQTNLVTKSDST